MTRKLRSFDANFERLHCDVLLFDEPTSGLDYKNMESVAEILQKLSKEGKTILVISHDNELLMKICSRIIRINGVISS